MRIRSALHSFTTFAIVLAGGVSASGADRFATTVRPLFERYCFECHGGGVAKGELDLGRFTTETSTQGDAMLWKGIEKRIVDLEMPPQTKPQPTQAERRAVIEWIDRALASKADAPRKPADPGRIPPRRLSRSEWRNAVRDVFGVEEDLTRDFPRDGSGGAGFQNVADTLFVAPLQLERYLAAATAAAQRVTRERLLEPLGTDVSDLAEDRSAAARIVSTHAMRAYRRPVTNDELVELLATFDAARDGGADFVAALREPVRAMLVSPSFLFRVERDAPGQSYWQIRDLELASRLAAFLWSSVPDDRLVSLALENCLSDPSTLRAEATRMLDDPRAAALVDDFAAQWLGYNNLLSAADPDRQRYPTYTDSLRDAMIEEARLFFSAIVREDRSAFELVDSTFTYLNEELAAHYGIAGVKGTAMRRVILTTPRRGGILTLGSTLVTTSYPLRTSPVNRGKFVLDEVLGDPPPPPPAAVGFLPADEHQSDGLTPRQRLERHRADPNCASCHARMDPLGFALENYDCVGAWRDDLGGAKVDSLGQLPDGTAIDGVLGLKRFLATSRRWPFVKALTEKMLSYALSRALEPADDPAVDAITQQVMVRDARMRELILAIVESFPFRYRGA